MGNSISTMKSNNGYLNITLGPMYAGKTSKLIDIYENILDDEQDKSDEEQKIPIVLTHSTELRYSIEKLSTHDKKQISCFKYDSIKTFINEKKDEIINNTNDILIDEAQFFTDLMEILYIVENLKKNVYIFGLDGDFKRNKFGNILDLIPFCDTITKLQANCVLCNNKAIFSKRTTQSNEQILIGSQDIYQPLCRNCYNNDSKIIQNDLN